MSRAVFLVKAFQEESGHFRIIAVKHPQVFEIEVLFISELNKLNEFGQLVALNTIREIAKKKEYQYIDYRQLKEADDDAPQDNP